MNERLRILRHCVRADRVELTEHAYDQALDRLIDIEDVLHGVQVGKLIEDYLVSRGEYRILVLQKERGGAPLHTVWDLPHGD